MANKARKTKASNVCGKRVKLARIEKDMTQLDLATALDIECGIYIDSGSISNLETGKRFVKDFEIIALSKILDKHPMWLLYGDKELKS